MTFKKTALIMTQLEFTFTDTGTLLTSRIAKQWQTMPSESKPVKKEAKNVFSNSAGVEEM